MAQDGLPACPARFDRLKACPACLSSAIFAVKTFLNILSLSLFCLPLSADEPATAPDPKDKLIVETVLRLKSFDLESSAKAKAAVLRYLGSQPGTDQYFELIERFQPVEIADDLADFSLKHATETSGVRGAELLFAMERGETLRAAIDADDLNKAVAAVTLIGHAGGPKTPALLAPLITDDKASAAVRTAAVTALGRSIEGQNTVLKLVTSGRLSNDLKFAAANVLLSSTDAAIKTEAAKHLQLPATADAQPLPPVAELVQRQGDAAAGAFVFRKTKMCINCHKVRGEGKEVGPDLSEIGSKLSREAMYVSILDPSAAISHNYENYVLVTEDGLVVTGLLVSDTDETVTLRTQEGIDKKFDKASLDDFQKLKISLMPTDIQKQLTVQELVDLVEYLLTLRKPGSVRQP